MPVSTNQTSNDYRAMRLALNLSQREVERQLAWKRGWISLLERGLEEPVRAAQLRDHLAKLLAAKYQAEA